MKIIGSGQVAPEPRMIGVLGGMGPLATVDFLAKVIAATPATCDQQHVPMIVHQVPQIPDRSTAILAGSDAPLAPMLAGLERLARAGAEVVAIPCNTAHHWYEPLTRLQQLPILQLPKRRGRSCRAPDPAVVALPFLRPEALIGLRDHTHWDRCVDTTLALARLCVRQSFES